MLGKTHHAGGTVAALVAFEVMRSKGLLISDCNELVQLVMMYPFTSFGSIFSDLDHGKDSIPSKDPVAMGINKCLRFFKAKHRSWQTHSLLVTGAFCVLLLTMAFLGNHLLGLTGEVEWAFIRLSTVGFVCGVGSHLILDSLTTGGIHLWPDFKIRLVPKTHFFATGGKWETAIFHILIAVSIIMAARLLWLFGIVNIVEYVQSFMIAKGWL